MPAINFQERFAGAVLSDEKRQTIRRVWKRPITPGMMLSLYTGLRTKRCEPIGCHVCLAVRVILIGTTSIQLADQGALDVYVAASWLNYFAYKDGFVDWPEMRDWFDELYGLPFEGVLIEW